MTKVLILPRHDVLAAGTRYRYAQFIPYLSAHGFECTIAPFFDGEYTEALLTAGRKKRWRLGTYFVRRLMNILSARQYDLVVIRGEIVPFLPRAFERLLAGLCAPYVLDFDDAFFHVYDQHPAGVVRSVFGSKIPELIRGAALNVAGSEYLASYARRFSRNVVVVPTVVDLARYPAAPVSTERTGFRIGWIGSPTTTRHLQAIVPELREFCQRRQAELVAIGAQPFDADGLPVRWVQWSEASEVQELAQTDIGIMPLPDTPWAAGKCGLKLIQAMACWRPVVASPVGANRQIVEHNVCGLHAEPGQWGASLERLCVETEFRRELGMAARGRVDEHYSLQAWAPRLARLWGQAASRCWSPEV
jgi:glycosyltransferase involved in cell wall biosynthesis